MREKEQALALKLYVVLNRASNAVNAHATADIATYDLTPGEFAVLEVLHHKGPLLLGDVQRRILASSGGVTYLVDRLQAAGLVERRLCAEDRRSRYAALTPAGEALMRDIFPRHAAAITRVMASLTTEEQERAVELLRKLGRAAAAAAPGEAEAARRRG